MLIAIWAQDQNGLIGKEEKLPWHLPNDLNFFRKTTEGHTVVMGRTTFEGMGKRLLPKRQTIILTRNQEYHVPGALVMHTVSEVLDYAKSSDTTTFITGGANVYQQFIPYCDQLYRTVIEGEFTGDRHFPEIDWSPFEKVASRQGDVDEKNVYPHVFETFQRKG